MAAGANFLSAVLRMNEPALLAGTGTADDLFTATERELRDIMLAHLEEFGALPGLEAITIASGGDWDELPTANEAPSYYQEQMMRRLIQRTLNATLVDVQNDLKAKPPRPNEALQRLVESCTELYLRRHNTQLLDFVHAGDLVMAETKKALGSGGKFVQYGWPYLDDMGVMRPGDLTTLVGRPARGKTFFLLWLAMNAWDQGFTPMVVSLEMGQDLIAQRLAAIYTSIDSKLIMRGHLGHFYGQHMKSQLAALDKSDKHPLWVVEGSRYSTVKDIQALAVQLKPDIVFVDGAYMLQPSNGRRNLFDAITETAYQLKHDLAETIHIPVTASYQFSREFERKYKKDVNTEAGTEDIYGSDAIGQLSSVILGLLDADTVASLQRRKVTVMKGRHGERGEFFTNWDFTNMDFSQWVEPLELMNLG